MYYVYFIISDTWGNHLPARRDEGLTRFGTELSHKVNTKKDAIALANKLVFLTTGERGTVFKLSEFKSNTKRMSWSNNQRTHHCEVSRSGVWTEFTENIKKGTCN